MSIANAKNFATDIDALFRFQLPDDMSQIDELKLVDPFFFVPPFPAPLISSNTLAPTNQYARKRELVQSTQKPATGPPLKKVKTTLISVSLDFKDDGEQETRFRTYQKDQWTERFEDLCAFVKKNGHSLVPNSFEDNPPLAHWTKRQRYQYKLKLENKPSTMTDDRVLALNALGFVWNAHEAGWEERFNELLQFKVDNGHCNVPSIYKENQKLATWVKCARRQYKLLVAGRKSNMTMERATRLASVGFVWELRPTIMK